MKNEENTYYFSFLLTDVDLEINGWFVLVWPLIYTNNMPENITFKFIHNYYM